MAFFRKFRTLAPPSGRFALSKKLLCTRDLRIAPGLSVEPLYAPIHQPKSAEFPVENGKNGGGSLKSRLFEKGRPCFRVLKVKLRDAQLP